MKTNCEYNKNCLISYNFRLHCSSPSLITAPPPTQLITTPLCWINYQVSNGMTFLYSYYRYRRYKGIFSVTGINNIWVFLVYQYKLYRGISGIPVFRTIFYKQYIGINYITVFPIYRYRRYKGISGIPVIRTGFINGIKIRFFNGIPPETLS